MGRRPLQTIFRPRLKVGLLLWIVIVAGLFSRTPVGTLPVLGKEIGDTLWAVMFYLWVLLFVTRLSVFAAAGTTIAITFVIEFLKLYHAPWFESLRDHRVGGLLLGHTFYWHDLLCYVLGTMIAAGVDRWVLATVRQDSGRRT